MSKHDDLKQLESRLWWCAACIGLMAVVIIVCFVMS